MRVTDSRVSFAELQQWPEDGRRYDTERRDRGRKMALVAQFHVPEYWIVEPAENTLEIYALTESDYALRNVYGTEERVQSPTLPGLSFDSARIFED